MIPLLYCKFMYGCIIRENALVFVQTKQTDDFMGHTSEIYMRNSNLFERKKKEKRKDV